MFSIEPVSFSSLSKIGISAAHYRHYREAGRKDTKTFLGGRAAHSLCLGGPEVVVYEGRRDARIAAWRDFQAEHDGAEILSPAEAEIAHGIANAVKGHSIASGLITGATHCEQELEWNRNGFACCGRVDFYKAGAYVGELKTCRSSDPVRFWREAMRFNYHAQLAWYREGLAFNSIDCPRGFIVAVESTPPHPVTVIEVHPRALDYGNRRCSAWLETLRQCVDADYWPGYVEGIQLLDVPDEDDFGLDFGEASDEGVAING